ncbi:MAG: LPS export ABC transporter periplasmic protein LptC [Gemmatimonadota bacterium]|nr:LPS export ABC transporter periplasmic protein LptC [Gemmatimonadota bacterium]
MKIPPRNSLLRFLAVALFVSIAASAVSCVQEKGKVVIPDTPRGDIPDQVFDGFEMTITENGIKKGWLRADKAEKYEGKKVFKAVNPEVIFYASNGEMNSVLTARRGIIHTETGDVEAFDSVVVLSRDSTRTLLTEHLFWNKLDNTIVSDSSVKITGSQGVVYGDGLVADAGLEDVEVKNPTGDIDVLGDGI